MLSICLTQFSNYTKQEHEGLTMDSALHTGIVRRQGEGQITYCSKTKWKNFTAAADTGSSFFPLNEGIRRDQYWSVFITHFTQVQINKIHFSTPVPSLPQQTKEKQFPAVCSKTATLSLYYSFLSCYKCVFGWQMNLPFKKAQSQEGKEYKNLLTAHS